jgi:hypothetical protein
MPKFFGVFFTSAKFKHGIFPFLHWYKYFKSLELGSVGKPQFSALELWAGECVGGGGEGDIKENQRKVSSVYMWMSSALL